MSIEQLRALTGAWFVEEGQAIKQHTLGTVTDSSSTILFHNSGILYFMDAPTILESSFPMSKANVPIRSLERAIEGYDRAIAWLSRASVAPASVDVHQRYMTQRLRMVANASRSGTKKRRGNGSGKKAIEGTLLAQYAGSIRAYHKKLEECVWRSESEWYSDTFELADLAAMKFSATSRQDTLLSRSEVIASALALSLDGKRSAIIANDNVLLHMLRSVVGYVQASPSKAFSEVIREYPIELFFTPGSYVRKCFDTRNSYPAPNGKSNPHLSSAIETISRAVS